jgi:hypothetical protein
VFQSLGCLKCPSSGIAPAEAGGRAAAAAACLNCHESKRGASRVVLFGTVDADG